jgi:hypothetical protein
MKISSSLALGALLLVGLHAPSADACGGFFCGQSPVDQTAERILFEVGDGSVSMTTQIAFAGDAEDFAWILPLAAVPDVASLSVVPQRALDGLDAQSGPVFLPPTDSACYGGCAGCSFGPPASAVAEDADSGGVDVYVQTTVGEYQVAVVGSTDPAALITWLRDNGYRVTPPMEPYIELYTSEGLKFLALKLLPEADIKQLSAFRFTLPGDVPSIPLRMTALAAEPEMAVVVFVLADQRFEGRNWENLAIADNKIRFDRRSYYGFGGLQTNWSTLVAQAVDAAGGQGWVTEFAGSSEPYAELVRNQIESGFFPMPGDQAAAQALLAAFEDHPYLTRLYTRLSAEEMTSDPIFGRSAGGDVSRQHQLQRIVDGVDQCSADPQLSTDPCDFATCGAGGLCRSVPVDNGGGTTIDVAACACLPGATARTTFAANGSPAVVCQDGRMSFLNAGDRELDTVQFLPDTCVDFECGEHGRCIAMNLTPTCVCDEGYVARGALGANGARQTVCVLPPEAIPASFYSKRLPTLPAELPGGRAIELPDDGPVNSVPGMVDGMSSTESGEFPMPRPTDAVARSSNDGGCSLPSTGPASGTNTGRALLAGGIAWLLTRRRGRKNAAS